MLGQATNARTRTLGLFVVTLLGCDSATGPTEGSEGPETVATVIVTAPRLDLTMGDTVRLAAEARNAAGTPMSGRVFSWTTDRTDVATVDGTGLVTGRGEGLAKITASTGGRSAHVSLQIAPVPAVPPTLASMNPTSIQAGWGSFTLTVSGSGFTDGARVLWNGQDLESFVLDPGEIHAIVRPSHVSAEGTVEISVETSSLPPRRSNPLTFTVFAPPALAVELRVAGNAVFVGNRVRLDAAARDQFGDVIVGKSIAWTSSDTTVARIENGHLHGLRVGSVSLTATATPTSSYMTLYVVTAPAFDVAFEASPNGFPELFLRSLDGDPTPRRLRPPGTYGKQVSATSDGARLVFVGRDASGDEDIYTMNRDGSGLTRLTTEPGIDDQPAWSPDGHMIAFRSFRQGKSDVWVMHADGTHAVNLTYASGFIPEEYNDGPTWSPDGQRIAFSRGFGLGQALVTIRADGSDLRELVASSGADRSQPAWSPNGQLIAFRSRDRFTGQAHVTFVSTVTGQILFIWTGLPVDAASAAWIDDEWVAVTGMVYPGSLTRSVALIRLGEAYQVVPLEADFGETAEPTGIKR